MMWQSWQRMFDTKFDFAYLTVYTDTPLGYHTLTMKSDISKKIIRQLSVIEGQVRGLKKMVEEDKYCIDVITQASAIRNSLSSVEEKMLENHLNTCAVTQMKGKKQDQAVSEILKVYKLAKRK
jgi:DNA-binding FrmR family transcriptional regulator